MRLIKIQTHPLSSKITELYSHLAFLRNKCRVDFLEKNNKLSRKVFTVWRFHD
jgi:hypothetical protein